MQKPYWHLSGFYFVYFASLGALIPFWSVYLNHLQFDSLEIGLLMSRLLLPHRAKAEDEEAPDQATS